MKVLIRRPECGFEFVADLKDFKGGLYTKGCPRCGSEDICEDDIIDWEYKNMDADNRRSSLL